MRFKHRYLAFLVATVALFAFAQDKSKDFHPQIPRVWDDKAMEDLELPPAAGISVKQPSSEYYYSIPVRPNLKTYPIYAPGHEPKGYWEWLKKQDPQPAFDYSKLRTRQDWINAGAQIFEAANAFPPVDSPFPDVRNPDWYKFTGVKLDKNGVMPYYRYVIRKKGQVEVTLDSCASCHTRVMPDGKVVRGAQGNAPFGRIWAYMLKQRPNQDGKAQRINNKFFGTPWIPMSPDDPRSAMTLREFAEHLATIPEGVNPRQGTSMLFPVQIPDLIGVKDRLYLDHTGLQQNRSIVDLMRYDAINNFIDEIKSYRGFVPSTQTDKLPDIAKEDIMRESDRDLYALALYLHSLKPPPNPNHFGPLAAKGKKVFSREGCNQCHTPPLYTSNKLTPAEGFTIPEKDLKLYRILDESVGTDPYLAMMTRRGTGFYKVPSLKGVWYRGPFEHNGSVATLEDWFDPHRLDSDYVPTGYKGYHTQTRAISGHPFGLDLSPEDKKALIAFLKTL
jgi:hypothetical protein